MEAQPIVLKHERIDDIPLLFGMMRRMNIANILDKQLPRHHLQKGLSNGNLAVGWLAYVLSQADHRKSVVQEWANGLHHTLESLYACPLRPHEFSDDRLGNLLSNLAAADWDATESSLFYATFEVYQLPTDCIHLDTTASCGYHTTEPGGIMQLGHSKDHRPDLPQLKIMAAVTQPLAFPVATAVVAGNQPDDVLYLPTIKQVQTLVGQRGVLFVADCKFSSIENRATVAFTEDYYLAPLPLTGDTAKLMGTWIDTALQKARSSSAAEGLFSVWREVAEGQPELIARGYEFARTLSCKLDEKTEVIWTERVQIVQPASLHESQKALLEKKLQQAQEQLEKLTRSGQGRRVWHEEKELQQAIADVLDQKDVEGLLAVEVATEETTKKRYGKSGRPRETDLGTTEVAVRYRISKVSRNEEQIEKRKERLGWRPMGTNAPTERLPFAASVETYREGAGMERAFHQLKDAPLGIRPLFVKRDEQIKGLTRFLLIALRVMTLIEIVVRSRLEEKQEALPGLHEGQKNKMESKPTAKRLLSGIARLHLTLVQIEYEGQQVWQMLALPELLVRVLDLLALPDWLYLDLTLPIIRPPPLVAFDTPVPLTL